MGKYDTVPLGTYRNRIQTKDMDEMLAFVEHTLLHCGEDDLATIEYVKLGPWHVITTVKEDLSEDDSCDGDCDVCDLSDDCYSDDEEPIEIMKEKNEPDYESNCIDLIYSLPEYKQMEAFNLLVNLFESKSKEKHKD